MPYNIHCENIDKLNEYQEKHTLQHLQEKAYQISYRGKFGAFRTLIRNRSSDIKMGKGKS